MGPLKPGDISRHDIVGGEQHVYEVNVQQGDFFRVLVSELDVDVEFEIIGPDGVSVTLDSPRRFQGRDSICMLAEKTGLYTVLLNTEKSLPGGSYEIELEAIRPPSSTDLQRFAAEQAFRAARTQQTGEQAIAKYQVAIDQWKELNDTRWTVYSLCRIARIYKALNRLPDALASYDKALADLTHDPAGRAFVLNEKGATFRQLANPSTAFSIYQTALDLRLGLADPWGAAQILDNLGQAYMDASYPQKAADAFNRALPLWREAQSPYDETNTVNNLAAALTALGDPTTALLELDKVFKYCESSQLCEQSRGRDLELLAHNNGGNIYAARADSEGAISHLNQALEIARRIKSRPSIALVLNNIGMTYAGLGDYEQARENLQAALAIRRELSSARDLAISLNNLGYVYELMGNFAEAREFITQALPLAEKVGNNKFLAYALTNLGLADASAGKFETSLEAYQRALRIQEAMGDQRDQAITLDRIGDVLRRMGQVTQAAKSYEDALQNWKPSGDRQGEALTLYNYADLEKERGNLDAARDKVEAAIGIVESLRTNLTSNQLRRTYFASKQDFYELAIDVRMQLYQRGHKDADRDAALAASERARARNLLDLLQDAKADGGAGVDPKLAERARQVKAELAAALESLLRQKALNHIEDAAAVGKRFDELSREDDRLQGQIRASRPGYAELANPSTVTVSDIQKLLDTDTLLLEYSLGVKRSYVWAVSRTGVNGYLLPGRAEVEIAARALRADLTAAEGTLPGETREAFDLRLLRSGSSLSQSSAALSRLVLNPLRTQLAQAKRLVIVPDGGLHYIPFEVLPLPVTTAEAAPPRGTSNTKLLATSKEIVYQPSVSALALIRNTNRRAATKAVAVLADPVFRPTDKRVSQAKKPNSAPTKPPIATASSNELARSLRDFGDGTGEDVLVPLPYSGREAEQIVSFVPAAQSLKVVGFEATLERAMSPELANYRVVHIASHTFLDSRHPEMSGIVLSLVDRNGDERPGFLNLNHIYNLHLPVEMVVLSACRTGIGAEVRGEGLMGLTRGFMYAGAARVVVSLWKVDDRATAAFMGYFYQHLFQERLSAAAALRAARADMLREASEWRSPFFWAGFVLQGEWQ